MLGETLVRPCLEEKRAVGFSCGLFYVGGWMGGG